MYIFKKTAIILIGILFLFGIHNCGVERQEQQEVQRWNDAEDYVESKQKLQENEENLEIANSEKYECHSHEECIHIMKDQQHRVVMCVNHICQFLRCKNFLDCPAGNCVDGYCLTCSSTCLKSLDCPYNYICKHYGYRNNCTYCVIE